MLISSYSCFGAQSLEEEGSQLEYLLKGKEGDHSWGYDYFYCLL